MDVERDGEVPGAHRAPRADEQQGKELIGALHVSPRACWTKSTCWRSQHEARTARPIKAVIYCRVSSDRQVREGDGLRSQETRCTEFAKQKGLPVLKVFRDAGVSGVLGRPTDPPRKSCSLSSMSSASLSL